MAETEFTLKTGLAEMLKGGVIMDVVTPEHALKMRNLLQHARLVVLPANHGSYLGEAASSDRPSRIPELTVVLVEEFLAQPASR